jgi:hypothetical protein
VATYIYECPEHGQYEVSKPMTDSGRMEQCPYTNDESFPCVLVPIRIYTSNAIHPKGSSGDGYFFNSKSGARSTGKKKDRWV